jgi:hypothetical protein
VRSLRQDISCVFSILIVLVAIVLWLRSRSPGGSDCMLIGRHRALAVFTLCMPSGASFWVGPSRDFENLGYPSQLIRPLPGIEFHRAQSAADVSMVRVHWLYFICTGFTLALYNLTVRLRRLAVRPINACPTCGYDLRATPERCPECGMAASQSR